MFKYRMEIIFSEPPDLSRGNLKGIYKELEVISEKLKVS